MGHGPWAMGHGPWAMGHGPWALGLGPWAMGLGTWAMGLGTWAMGHGPWAMGHGPWVLIYEKEGSPVLFPAVGLQYYFQPLASGASSSFFAWYSFQLPSNKSFPN